MSWDISRRVFLRGTGLAALGIGFDPSSLLVRTAEAAPGAGTRVLVHVFLRGGADGLSMAAPYGEAAYYDSRGEIALPRPGHANGLVALDDHFGLHPSLAPLKPLFTEGRLGLLHAVGNYDVTRSHFSAQDFVEMGTPGVRTTTTGALSRTESKLPGSGVAKGVSFSTQRPVSFLGPDAVFVAANIASFRLRAKGWEGEAEQKIKAIYGKSPLAELSREIFDAIEIFQKTPGIKAEPANGAVYPDAPVGLSLRQAAQIIKSEIGTRCIFVPVGGGFDTHSNQLAGNVADFAPLGQALAAFDRDLGRKIDDVVVLVTTEFGRTVFLNGSHGTDHGSGYCAFYLGGRVKGGKIHGRWPGLAKSQLYEERDLAVTTDFRDAFAEVARVHLGISDTASLFPGFAAGPGPGVLA